MKTSIFILTLLLAISCSEKKESKIQQKEVIKPADTSQINKKIRDYISKHANDPSSYQPINTILYDTILKLDYYKSELELYSNELMMDTLTLEKKIERAKLLKKPADTTSLMYLIRLNTNRVKLYKNEIEELKKSNNPNAIYGYKYAHQCRLKNKMGALTLSQYNIITDSLLNIDSFVE